MKFRVLYSTAIVAFAAFAFFSFSSGPTQGAGDRTGSPVSNGNCTGCHSPSGQFNPTTTITLRDAGGNFVTNGMYVPGATYTVTGTVTAPPVGMPPNTSVAKYGLQLVALLSTNANAGTLSAPTTGASGGGAGAKLTTINSRTYLEHNTRSTDGIFNATWTAPTAGSGAVTFYASGLAINGTATSGDNLAQASVAFTEATSIADVNIENLDFKAFPNPVIDQYVNIEGLTGEVVVKVTDMMGRIVVGQALNVQNNSVQIHLENLPQGVYNLLVEQGNAKGVKQLVVQR